MCVCVHVCVRACVCVCTLYLSKHQFEPLPDVLSLGVAPSNQEADDGIFISTCGVHKPKGQRSP